MYFFFFYIPLWKSYKKPVCYFSSFLFHELNNVKINIFWDADLGHCSLAEMSSWIPILYQYEMRISEYATVWTTIKTINIYISYSERAVAWQKLLKKDPNHPTSQDLLYCIQLLFIIKSNLQWQTVKNWPAAQGKVQVSAKTVIP